MHVSDTSTTIAGFGGFSEGLGSGLKNQAAFLGCRGDSEIPPDEMSSSIPPPQSEESNCHSLFQPKAKLRNMCLCGVVVAFCVPGVDFSYLTQPIRIPTDWLRSGVPASCGQPQILGSLFRCWGNACVGCILCVPLEDSRSKGENVLR